MEQYKIEDVLEFLSELRSRQEIAEKFELSPNESWHLVRWLEKGKYVRVHKRVPIEGRSRRMLLYKRL